MSLPDLGSLKLTESEQNFRDAWKAACGPRPDFEPWDFLGGSGKWELLHNIARDADTDAGPYLTPYNRVDVDVVLADGHLHSVEHVVPRSMINGGEPGIAEDDPLGWAVATRTANARRSNLPLVLWPGAYDGPEHHFSPPESMRAFLARKWLFIRVTYGNVDSIQPPSDAQHAHRKAILKLAKSYPLHASERRFSALFADRYDYQNPLLQPDADRWYDSPWLEAIVFGNA